ncbi:MAG: methionyl-tRNA formyltransferase [bacterium]
MMARILFFGTSTFALPALQQLHDAGYSVVGVVTQPDRPSGRGGKVTPTPVKLLAESLCIPVFQPESCREPAFIDSVRTLEPDLSVVVAYGQFLPDILRLLPHLGTVNLHGSLLPAYRGAAPVQRAVWAGEERTGVTLMWMAKAMDAGDIIATVSTDILPTETGGELYERLAALGAPLLLERLPAILAGTAPHIVQDAAAVTFAPMIKKEERLLDWRNSAIAIMNQVRALAPAPAAYTTIRGIMVKILAVDVENFCTIAGTPGEIVEFEGNKGIYVATGAGIIRLAIVHPAGKRPMSGADFNRGNHLSIGECFT